MGRQFSTSNFFRQMPNVLLARYFQARGLRLDVDFATLKETKIDPLLQAWLRLSDDERGSMDADFREIFDLGSEKGFRAVLDEAKWHLMMNARDTEAYSAFVDQLAGLSNHSERAMVAFLDHHQYWKGATHFYHADTLSYWRKRKHLPHVAAAVDEGSLQELADLIRTYFRYTEGRGNNCVVEPFRRGELDYFFAYPEDYSKNSVEWVQGQFDRRPHNPAFEVIYVYSRKDGTLDLNCPCSYKAIEPLQGIFATAILKLPELPPDPKDGSVYDLNLLLHRDFEFVFDPGSGIYSVAVKKLRLSSIMKRGDRVTLEADTSHNLQAVYDLLDRIKKSLPLHAYHVTQVELSVSVAMDPSKPLKTLTVRITYPNSCSLKYDELDLKLRTMLHDSSIEPKESTEALEAADAKDPTDA